MRHGARQTMRAKTYRIIYTSLTVNMVKIRQSRLTNFRQARKAVFSVQAVKLQQKNLKPYHLHTIVSY